MSETKNEILLQIKSDNLSARKSKNKEVSSLLTTLISEIEIVGKNKLRITTEDETIKVIEKFSKNVSSTIELVGEKENLIKELNLYNSYLPEKLSEQDLEVIIKEVIAHDSEINIGKVMGFLKKQYNGKYDGKLASKIIKSMMA